MTNDELIWNEVSTKIKNSGKIYEVQYNTWIKSIEKAKFGNSTLFLWVPNTLAKSSVEERYIDLIKEYVLSCTKKNYNIVVLLRGENMPEEEKISSSNKAPKIINDDFNMLNKNHTFDNFIVGNSNRFAHAYSLSVAEAPGGKFNPLFLYGGVGLGKTHLCHAIGNFVKENNPDINLIFVSSEKYTTDFINSLRDKTLDSFREKYRKADILIVDDIQFIQGKESTIEEFFHTFNELYENNKQIVLAADRAPGEIDIEERLKSRFEWGLSCDIIPPDFETRIAILKNKSKNMGYEFSDDIYSYIADNIKNNIRQLEGALLKVVAYASLNPGNLDEETVINILKDFVVSKEKLSLSYDTVIRTTAKYFHITTDEILGESKRKEIAFARQVCMYLCSQYVKNATMSQIGREFKRDHSTVCYALNKVEDDIKKNENIASTIKDIESLLF